MANKRMFKKYVNALGASMLDEITMAYDYVENANKEELEKACAQVLGAIGAAKANSNRFFDRGRKGFADPKEYSRAKRAYFVALFNKIDSDFDTEIKEALKLLNHALPEEVKKAQKEAVAE